MMTPFTKAAALRCFVFKFALRPSGFTLSRVSGSSVTETGVDRESGEQEGAEAEKIAGKYSL